MMGTGLTLSDQINLFFHDYGEFELIIWVKNRFLRPGMSQRQHIYNNLRLHHTLFRKIERSPHSFKLFPSSFSKKYTGLKALDCKLF